MINFNHPDLQDPSTANKTFSDLPLHPILTQALSTLNYLKPTTVQFHSIPLGIARKSIVVQSKSGTGKTLAYVAIFLQKLIEERKEQEAMSKVRVLVLEPTRELAVQVYQFIRKVMAAFRNVKGLDEEGKAIKAIVTRLGVGLNIGGLPIDDDKKNYHEAGFDIAVGTVGRVFELTSKNVLDLSSTEIVVLDEGDKLFQQADTTKRTKVILSKTSNPQLLVYSATYTEKCFEELGKLGKFTFAKTVASGQSMKIKISEGLSVEDLAEDQTLLGLSNITKLKCRFVAEDKSIFSQKLAKTKQLLSNLEYKKCLLFVEKKAQMPQVSDYLKQIEPLMIHGSLCQSARIKLLNQLNSCKVIITSDLLARGIDILVDLIILFNAAEGENFWHRIGRTGRIGRKGLVISLDEIPTWEEFTWEKAKQSLKEADFKHEKQMFGEYLTEIGRWHEVDTNKEIENINKYKYFDEEKFEKDIQLEVEMELEQDSHQQQGQDRPQQCEIDVQQKQVNDPPRPTNAHKHPPPPIPKNFTNRFELSSYLESLLSCPVCREQLQRTESLTGYRFKIWQYVGKNQT